MHIKNLSSGKSHRHFLAAPLFLLFLATTVVGGSTRMQAEVMDTVTISMIKAVHEDHAFSLPRGVYGLLREDGVLSDDGETLTVEEGTTLIASQGLVRFRVDDLDFSAFRGGLFVTKNGSKFTIHALTSPVLLSHGSFRLIIPQGMQASWKSADDVSFTSDLLITAAERSKLTLIPDFMERDELAALAGLTPADLPGFTDVPALSSVLAPLALPAAQQRLSQQSVRAGLADFRALLASGDTKESRARLQDPLIQQVLLSDNLPADVLPTLLADSTAIPSVTEQLLLALRDPDLWLLLSFHKDYRAAAWEASGPLNLPVSYRLERWLQLPSSDIGEGISPHVIDRWNDQVQKYVFTAEHPLEFLEPLLLTLKDYRQFLDQNDYPERLRHYASALQQLVGPTQDGLSDNGKAIYAQWKDVDAVAAYVEPPPLPPAEPVAQVVIQQSSSSSSSSDDGIYNPADVEAAARTLLQDAGALFTLTTTIHATTAMTADVRGILFANPQAESTYDFTLDIAAKRLKSLERDGQPFPYALTLDAFAMWAKSGK